jgi:hypothetical protein
MTLSPLPRRWARRGTAAAAVAGALALVPGAAAVAAPAAPTPVPCPAVSVTSAELVRTTSGPGILVHGVAPAPNLSLHLVPEDVVYIRQPEYWRYFVTACGPANPVVRSPFTKVFRVPTSPVGSLGIEIGPSQINL